MKKNQITKIILTFIILSSIIKSNAQEISKATALEIVKANKHKLNLQIGNTEDPYISSAYTDPQTGLSFIYIQQQFKGIKVFNQIKSSTFKNTKLLYTSGNFVPKISGKAPSETPSFTAKQSVEIALKKVNAFPTLPISESKNDFFENKKIEFNQPATCKRKVTAELFWLPNDKGEIKLVWSVKAAPKNTSDNWDIKVDALSGKIIDEKNETVYENKSNHKHNISYSKKNTLKKNTKKENRKRLSPPPPPATNNATYRVVSFPNEHPNVSGFQNVSNPWSLAGANNNATTFGWHFDGISDFDITRGNNVFAYDDSNDINAPTRVVQSTTNFPNLNFPFNFNLSKSPSIDTNRNAAITNLFYWNNIIHDVFYQYGFNEVSGNFQNDNLNRGGVGGDAVAAEGQDGGGKNNANFYAAADGGAAIMQMYLWNAPSSGLNIISPSSISGIYSSREGAISTNNLLRNVGTVTGQLILYNDNSSGTANTGCSAATNNLSGKIALIKYTNSPNCTYRQRVKNAQNAGAIGVIMINTSDNLVTMTGTDNTITIPAVLIGLTNGNNIISKLTNETVTVRLNALVELDGDLDNGIITHEYGHGISNRLTGGPNTTSCLNNAEQAGEGWSDYFALMLTTNWASTPLTDGNRPRPMGSYAAGRGIRAYPYSTNINTNPLTYINLSSNGQVHFIGTVWCTALWDMTWDIIAQENKIETNIYNASSNGGNVIALNLVMLGLKLQPCNPGFLDARDAILAADDILYNGRHKCTIWKSFARRGMGYSASQGSNNSTSDQNPAFDIPESVTFSSNIEAFKIIPSTNAASFNIKATCQCKVPINNYKIVAILGSDFNHVSNNAGGIVSGDTVVFRNVNFQTEFQSNNIDLTLRATNTGCIIDSNINDNRDNRFIGGLSNVSVSGNNPFYSGSTYSYSPVNSWEIKDPETPSSTTLTSNAINIKPLSLFSFWHKYEFEPAYDGGLVEVRNGTIWETIENFNLSSKYNTTIDASNTFMGGQRAYSGSNNDFENAVFDLSSFKNSSLRLRFRVATDNMNGNSGQLDGWNIDNIVLANGCGNYIKFYIYDSANNLLDSSKIPVFVTPKPLPVNILSFKANSKNKTSLLNWQVANEINIKDYIIERSINGRDFKTIGKVNAIQKSNYNFIDEKPNNGLNYYRFVSVENNGSNSFSEIVTVNFNSKTKFEITPNPAKDEIRIVLNDNQKQYTVAINDITGRVVLQKTFEALNNIIQVNTTSLQVGTYIVNIYDKNERVYTEKLVIIK